MLKAFKKGHGEAMTAVLTGRDFVVFSDDWGRHPFSCQHIMQHFLPQNRILWVNTIGMRTPGFNFYDFQRALGKVKSWTKKAQIVTFPDGLHVISPVMMPFNHIPAVRRFNRQSVISCVSKAMKDLGMKAPVLLATVPNAADYVGHLGESSIIYYCVDDFTVWPGMNLPEMVRDMEERLVAEADLVVAVSKELCKSRRCGRGQTRLLTHGVDIEHFLTASHIQPRPISLADIKGLIIGFYGLIDNHLDLGIVQGLVDRHSDWTVVLIGTKRISLGQLEGRSNFRWLPAVPYADLPKYASAFDVAIIPYVLNQHTHTANPLKFKEYLATGKPVVTTPMAEVLPYAGQAHLAQAPEDFADAVEASLSETVRVEDRLSCLAGETWKDKAAMLSAWIEEVSSAGFISRKKLL